MKRKFTWQWLLCFLFIGIACLLPTDTAKAEIRYAYEFNEEEKGYYLSGIWEDANSENPEALYDLTLSTTYEGYPVVGIKEGCFANSSYGLKIKSVVIPETYTTIERLAFAYCTNLEEVVIKGKITTIKDETFYGCHKLGKVTLPDSLEKIEESAFHNSGLKSITIPESVTSIESGAFCYCSNLEEVVINGRIKNLESDVFYGCQILKKVTLPDSLENIKERAFGYSGLTSITIPKSVTSMESNAFSDCTNLEKVDIKGKITTLKTYTFSGCSTLKTVILPDTLKKIEDNAFSNIPLEKITIPKSVKTIGNYVFANCTNLYQVIFKGDKVTFGNGALPTERREALTIVAKKGSDAYAYGQKQGFLVSESSKFKVELNGTKMFVGEKKRLTVYNNPSKIKWTTSKKSVVAIDKKGRIVAKKKGTATITAKINGKKYKYKIKVVKRTEKNVLDIVWSNYVTKDMSDYEKAVAANKFLAQNVKYDYDNYLKNTIPYVSHTAEGALAKGIAVCDGYTYAYQKIIDHYGIPNKVVVGTAGGGHAWNLVKIGTRWYHVDVTWNDPVSTDGHDDDEYVSSWLLLVSDKVIGESHNWTKKNYPKASAKEPDKTVTTVNKKGIKISTLEKELKVGKSATLKVTGTKKKVTWSSSNSKIVKVDKKGKITAKKKGTATIYFKVDGKKYAVKVTVTK